MVPEGAVAGPARRVRLAEGIGVARWNQIDVMGGIAMAGTKSGKRARLWRVRRTCDAAASLRIPRTRATNGPHAHSAREVRIRRGMVHAHAHAP